MILTSIWKYIAKDHIDAVMVGLITFGIGMSAGATWKDLERAAEWKQIAEGRQVQIEALSLEKQSLEQQIIAAQEIEKRLVNPTTDTERLDLQDEIDSIDWSLCPVNDGLLDKFNAIGRPSS